MKITREASNFCDSCDRDEVEGVTIRLENGIPLLCLCLGCFDLLMKALLAEGDAS